jgi:hypothetical protein
MRREPSLPQELWEQIPPPFQAAIWVTVEGYERHIAALEAEVGELKERFTQNSQNSARPPFSEGPPPVEAGGGLPPPQLGRNGILSPQNPLWPDPTLAEVPAASYGTLSHRGGVEFG